MRSLTLAFLLAAVPATAETLSQEIARSGLRADQPYQIGRASCRERV